MADKKDPVIPAEVLKMDARSLQMYKEALNEGKEKVYNIRVMVVGQYGVGKSTLIKRLLGQDVDISTRMSTDGIVVHRECCKVSLATGEWIRLQNDAEQYSTLQRLVKFLNEHVQEQDSEGKREGQNEIHDQIALKHLRGDPSHGQSVSAEQDINQKDKTTFSQSVVTPTVNIGPELTVDIGNSENEMKDIVMEMLQLINTDCDRLEKNFEEYATLSVYDFPGQFASNTTNYMFLSSRAIYLLVVDLSQELTDLVEDEIFLDTEGIKLCKVHELIEHFLNDIHSCSPSSESGIPQVILVGTHVDKIPEKYRQKVIDKYFMEIRRMLIDKPIRFHLMYDDFAIDNTICDPKLEDLKKTIVQLASQQPYWGKETPARWLPLEHAINILKASGVKVVPLRLVEDINRLGSFRIESKEEIAMFLRFQHDIGTILYFSVEGLRETIVLDPQWIMDALKSLITSEMLILRHPSIASKWFEFSKKGILTLELIDAIWSRERNPEFHDNKDHILLIMERLNIIARPRSFSEVGVKEEHYFIAPFMLQNTTPREIITPKQNLEIKNSSVLTFVFKEKYLPAPIFHRLLAACVAHWPIARENREKLIFFKCCVFRLDIHHRLTLHFRDYIIFARVTRKVTTEKALLAKLCAEVRLFLFVQLSKIIGSLGRSLQFELHIQCPDCDADSSEGLIPVSMLQKNYEIICDFHDHVLVSHDLLQFWFDEMDEGDLSLPLEILRMDDNSIKIFKEALKDGEEEVNNIRIMVVGHTGVGKTTLIKRLLEKEVVIEHRCSTEGIDVHINCCGVNLKTGEWKAEQTDTKDSQLIRLNKILHETTRKENVTKETEKQQVSYDADKEQEENDGTQIVQVTKDTEERKENEGRERKENEGTQIVQVTKDTEERKENEGRERKENEDPMNVQTQKADIIAGNVEQRAESKQQIRPKNIQSTGSQSSNQNEMLYALGENLHKVQRYTGDYALMSVWDFAGQYAFYTTHQMFLTRRAIYLLVSNVSQKLDDIIKDKNDPYFIDCKGKTDCKVHELVEVWINSIHSCADPKEPGVPPVILVGTHVDEVRKKELEKTSQAQARTIKMLDKEIHAEHQISEKKREGKWPTPVAKKTALSRPNTSRSYMPKKAGMTDKMTARTIRMLDKEVHAEHQISGKKRKGKWPTPVAKKTALSRPNISRSYMPKKAGITDKMTGASARSILGQTEGINSHAIDEAVNKACADYFNNIRSHLQGKPTRFHLVDETFAIDNSVIDEKLEKLKMKIVEIASQQSYWGEKIPARWLPLEQALMNLKEKGRKVISYNEVQKINNEGAVPIEKSEELDLFLKFLHETGTIIYFSIEVLKDNIVLDPRWLIDALKCLINAKPNLPENSANNGSQSSNTVDHADAKIWSDFKEKGKLRSKLVDYIWTKEKHPELHDNKQHILLLLEHLSIIAKPRSFSDKGVMVKENYFFTPCILHQESPSEVIFPKEDPRIVSTSILQFDFTEKFLPPAIFHRLLAACIARWKVAKKESKNLIFCGCCVFDLDLFHRLTLYLENHIISARITVMVDEKIKSPDAELCSRVKRFITMNLFKITSCFGKNLQFELCIKCQPYQMWLADADHHPDAAITPEHMNHARFCVALTTVCSKAMREILCANLIVPYNDISQALLANYVNLTTSATSVTKKKGRPLLNADQIMLVFPDPPEQKTGTVDQFDITLLYTLIRNISKVTKPAAGWGTDPQRLDDTSLGASVERIRLFRNHVSGHSPDAKMSEELFKDYWKKLKDVLHAIDAETGKVDYVTQLNEQEKLVISVYEVANRS